MRITVNRIQNDENGKRIVFFSSQAGDGIGEWKDTKYQLRTGDSYDIEFTISEQLRIDVNLRRSQHREYIIRAVSGSIEFAGVVESVDEDGVFYFRLGRDCLVLLGPVLNGNVASGDWIEVMVPIKAVEIYPYDHCNNAQPAAGALRHRNGEAQR